MSKSNHDQNIDVPLRKWIQDEAKRKSLERKRKGPAQVLLLEKQALLRKTTVAYGIVELLRHVRKLSHINGTTLAHSAVGTGGECRIDNFVVQVSPQDQSVENKQNNWDDVRGVKMISPALSGNISEPSFVTDAYDEYVQKNRMGKYQIVDINPPLIDHFGFNMSDTSDSNDCYSFGVLFYELCSGMCPFSPDPNGNPRGNCPEEEPPRKKSTVRYDKRKGKSYSTMQTKPYSPLKELGFPSSVSTLVQNLIDGHEEYTSLTSVSSDIHLLLSDPDCFLFDFNDSEVQGGNAQLQIKKDKLYGREEEISLVTDAFCRVSMGNNEAIFIGGYSGSGKTMLVKSLIARVDISGGYVLTQKVDQMSKDKSNMLDILSAFNKLCLLIKEKSSQEELLMISDKLKNDFESDFSVLARLLPNINVVFPELAKPTAKDTSTEQMMNLHNVPFLLQRFMRIVSSRLRPVMLFLDE